MTISFQVGPSDVANEALALLGKDPINDIEDQEDPVAVKCLRFFRSILRAMLRDHTWHFATHRIQLAWTGIRPVSDFAYAYALPPDCFRVIRVNSSDKSVWKIEDTGLLMNESTATIEYIKWVSDPNLWPGDFYQAFVTYLAVRLAPALHSDMAKASDLYKTYQAQLWDAKATDGQSGSSQEQITCDVLTAIRE